MTALRLTPADQVRRQKLAGMLGNAFDGERLSALAMLQKMADAYKIKIHELLLADIETGDRQRVEQAERRAHEANLRAQRAEQAAWEARRAQRPAEPAQDAPKLPPDWRARFAKAQELNRSRSFLTTWETDFAANVVDRGWRSPSPKQAVVIVRILEKAKTFGAASAGAEWEDTP